MKLIEITNPIYLDNNGIEWAINADNKIPVIKQYIDKIINVTQEAIRDFKSPIVYNFWLRLREGKTISNFLDTLKKYYFQKYGFLIKYVQVKESDGDKFDHHHILLFVDRRFAHPSSLSHFLTKQTGKDKLLFCQDIPKGNNNHEYMTLKTEDEIKDVIHRASYLAKTRSKVIGDGVIQMTTSRLAKEAA